MGSGYRVRGDLIPLSFLVIKTYMDTVPVELLEVSRLDGASYHRSDRVIEGMTAGSLR